MLSPSPEIVYFCYSQWQSLYDEISQMMLVSGVTIVFHQGIKPVEEMEGVTVRKLVIYDDLMNDINDEIADVFTKKSHHQNLTAVFLTQNLFQKAKQSRVVSLNAKYLGLFKAPRDKAQIMHLARSMYPGSSKYMIDAYTKATAEPHQYLWVDLRQETPENMRLRSKIFPDETTEVWVPAK